EAVASAAHSGLAKLKTLAELTTPKCATYGLAFNDTNIQRVNGAFLPDAQACQDSCKSNVYCEHFTFYNDSKACWIQGNNVTTFHEKDAISGPQFCAGEEKQAVVVADAGAVPLVPAIPGVTAAWLQFVPESPPRATPATLGVMDTSKCYSSAPACEAARGVCYQKVMMQKKADASTCFVTTALCESGGATCYAKKGNMCVMLQEVADDKTCFPTAALCASGGAVCFGNKGGHCVMLQQIADGVSCYSTQFDCKRFLPLTLGLQVGEAPLMSQDAAQNATNATAAAAATDSGASSGFPWWGWVLGGLGLAGAAGAATVLYSSSSTVPLMQAVEMPPLAPQFQQFAAAPTYSAAPMASYSAAPVAASYAAAPMATYSAPQGYSVSAAPVNYAAPMNYAPAAPTYSAAPPAMYSPAPVPNYAPAPVAYSAAPANYAQEPVANYAPAAPTYMQPVSAMAAQFNRADLDGDGVISREEYARLTGHQ
ncbi:unnamed protein product, partial [Polarella glacialis]